MKKRREWVGTISQRRRKILAMKMRTAKLLLKKHTKKTWHSGFVKVNMDGLPIGRKVDLNAHDCYETLAHAFEVMLLKTSSSGTSIRRGKQHHSQLLDGSSEFVLTYEDREGDWMLVGDVPWRYNSNIFHL